MCLAQGPQRSEAGGARTRGPSVLSQALYHLATALPLLCLDFFVCSEGIGYFFTHHTRFLETWSLSISRKFWKMTNLKSWEIFRIHFRKDVHNLLKLGRSLKNCQVGILQCRVSAGLVLLSKHRLRNEPHSAGLLAGL